MELTIHLKNGDWKQSPEYITTCNVSKRKGLVIKIRLMLYTIDLTRSFILSSVVHGCKRDILHKVYRGLNININTVLVHSYA